MKHAARRPTQLDFVVMALAPALIMALVGSLAFFLIDVFYAGPHLLRLKWVMFWFVMGIVLIARIAIEIDADRAAVYGLALAMAVALVMVRFAGSPLLAWLLLAIVWWCAHQLTFDCTLIDDNDDASGEGLMQIVGLDRPPAELQRPAPTAPRSPWWRRLLLLRRRAGEPHAPGLWVVYFSLAALPLFGIGQLFLPASDAQRRQYAFWCICVYVASALGLLAVTSLLGLRRYLRQRGLGMPEQMTAMWLGIAAAVAMAVLVLGSFLPRPGSSWLSSRRPVAQGPRPPASSHAIVREGTGRGAGTPGQDPSSPTRQEEPRDATQGSPAQRGTASGQQPATRGQQSDQMSRQQPTDQPRRRQPYTQEQAEDGTAAGQPAPEQSETSQQDSGGSSAGSRSGAQSGQQRPGSQAGGQSSGREEDAPSRSGARGERQGSPSAGSDAARKSPTDGAAARSEQPAQPGEHEPPSHQGAEKSSGGETAASPEPDPAQERSSQQSSPGSQEERSAEAGSRSASDGRPTGPPSSQTVGQPSQGTWRPSLGLAALGNLLKWLVYALLAATAAVLLVRNWRRLLRALAQLVADLAAFLQGWLGRRPRQAAPPPAAPAPPPRPFAAFANPFLTGEAAQAQPLALTLYTYAALQAWAREQGTPPQPEQTPMEFAKRVGEHHPYVAHEAAQLALVYSQTVYGRRDPDASCLPLLRRMWERLSQPQAQVASIGEG
ncbi:MAG: DUF4129 domain-containing protein [Pirellulales bacterium]|nr:DUF4129 domain-containing protein [Pirellulales bacterium]